MYCTLTFPTQAVNQESLRITLCFRQIFLHKKVLQGITLLHFGAFLLYFFWAFLPISNGCPKEANPLSRVKIDHAKWVSQSPDSDCKVTKFFKGALSFDLPNLRFLL